MLKFWLKKERLDFTKGWVTSQKDTLSNEEDDDLLARLSANSITIDEVISAIVRAEGDGISDTMDLF